MSESGSLAHLFVYGTLQPGEERWCELAPWVIDEGHADSVPGRLYDSGLGYPAAEFGDSAGLVHGRTYELKAATLGDALVHLDEVEDAALGIYRRIVLTTDRGVEAYAYEYGGGLTLTPVSSGDWLSHRTRAS